MLPVVTRTVAKSINIEKTVGGDKERALVYRKIIPFLGGGGDCLVVALPVYLLLLLFTPKQVKLIHRGLYFLIGHVDS